MRPTGPTWIESPIFQQSSKSQSSSFNKSAKFRPTDPINFVAIPLLDLLLMNWLNSFFAKERTFRSLPCSTFGIRNTFKPYRQEKWPGIRLCASLIAPPSIGVFSGEVTQPTFSTT